MKTQMLLVALTLNLLAAASTAAIAAGAGELGKR